MERERERERESMNGGGQRKKETQNLKQAPGSRLHAVSTEPNVGLEHMTVRSRPEPRSDA